jgi:hypothetical protein
MDECRRPLATEEEETDQRSPVTAGDGRADRRRSTSERPPRGVRRPLNRDARQAVVVGLVVLLALAMTGCVGSIGGLSRRPALSAEAWGAPRALHLCVLRDPVVSPARVDALVEAWRHELAPFGIHVVVPWQREWPRPGFTGRTIAKAVARMPLEPGCDRLIALIGRHAGDGAYALAAATLGLVVPLPEFMGWVDNVTMTHGFVVAQRTASLAQLVLDPAAVMIHEGYHLLGCDHDSWHACYAIIAQLKREPAEDGFFPARGLNGWIARSREDVNAALATARWE